MGASCLAEFCPLICIKKWDKRGGVRLPLANAIIKEFCQSCNEKDWRIASAKGGDAVKVAAVRAQEYTLETVVRAVDEALKILGGIEKYIQTGERVLLKPNMLDSLPSERAVTTHPQVLRAMIRQVKSVGAIPVVGDSPGVAGTLRAAEKCGIMTVCQEEDTELAVFETSVEFPFPAGETIKKFQLTQVLTRVDKVISLAKMKTHTFMGVTGAAKNMFGCIVGMQKAQFHLRTQQRREFAGMLADLAILVKPVLSVVDGIVGMEGNGPRNGKPVKAGILLAGENCFAVDIVMAQIMGFPPESIPLSSLAITRGLTPPHAGIEILGDARAERLNFVAPRSMMSLEDRLPGWFVRWGKSHLTSRPHIGLNCIGCGRCVIHCPPRAMTLTGGKVHIEDEKCIRCYCCQELCPENAVQLKDGLMLALAQKFM